MSGAAVRSRLLTLRRQRHAALNGRELLERKREVLHRELVRRSQSRMRHRQEAAEALSEARRQARRARVDAGRADVAAAALAQPADASVSRRDQMLVGIRLAILTPRLAAHRPRYGAAGTTDSIDAAAATFSALLPALIALAQEEAAVASLQAGLARTIRRLNALDKVVVPGLEREIRAVTDALEEEERDEAFRRKRVQTHNS